MYKRYQPKSSYFRVAAATPEVAIGDISTNIANILSLYNEACEHSVSLVIFPELSITGYSLGDIVRQRILQQSAFSGLYKLAHATQNKQTAMVVGLPYAYNDSLYNCAALLSNGKVQGIVTKSNIPNYGEFYEQRWYRPFKGMVSVHTEGYETPFGEQLLFNIDGVLVGIEICEDMWVPQQPSRRLTASGALIIANPSASPELVGKSDYRTELVKMTAAVQRCAYIYSGAGWTESTTDTVMSGHAIIAENGTILAERSPFASSRHLLMSDIDIDHLLHDRILDTTYKERQSAAGIIQTNIKRSQTDTVRTYQKSYFVPVNEAEQQKSKRLSRIITIQAHGLARRILSADAHHCVLGLSGGLDSTLALIVCLETAKILQRKPTELIHTITMPGPASSTLTQNNALKLAAALNVQSVVLPIDSLSNTQLTLLQHEGSQDITYENVQARSRTNLLFNYANKIGGIVVGTGDLSELALGWCTFGGDQLSSYNVNASIPKTLVKDLVAHAAILPEYKNAQKILLAICNTPISPELTTKSKESISQSTEEIIGPYIVHDFFLYHVVRFGDAPEKIAYIATKVFADTYTKQQIHSWLEQFYKRFSANQFKRSAMPDGPKVGSIALSPRGDWRMPSDMNAALWQ